MKTLQKTISYFLKIGTIVSSFAFICITLIQIYGRFFMEKAPSWTEEAARLFFVFAIAFASGLAMKTNFYVSFDFVFNKFSKFWQNNLLKISYVLILILCIIFSYYGILWVQSGWQEQSPSMKFPMAIAFMSMPLLGFSIGIFAIFKLIKIKQNKITTL